MKTKAEAIANGALQDAELDRLAVEEKPDPYDIAALAVGILANTLANLTSPKTIEREAAKRQVKNWVKRFASET